VLPEIGTDKDIYALSKK